MIIKNINPLEIKFLLVFLIEIRSVRRGSEERNIKVSGEKILHLNETIHRKTSC